MHYLSSPPWRERELCDLINGFVTGILEVSETGGFFIWRVPSNIQVSSDYRYSQAILEVYKFATAGPNLWVGETNYNSGRDSRFGKDYAVNILPTD